MSNVFPTQMRLVIRAMQLTDILLLGFCLCVCFFFFPILNSNKANFKALGYVVFIAQNWQMFHVLEINLNDIPVLWVVDFIFHSRGRDRVEVQVWRMECNGSAERSWTDMWHMMWHPKGLDSNKHLLALKTEQIQGRWKTCVSEGVLGDEWKVSQPMAAGWQWAGL